MALNFTLFDPTYQTSNFYSAIAQIEKGGFKDGIYEVFEWTKDYAVFTSKENIEILKQFFQKNSSIYQVIWETELDEGGLLIVQVEDISLSLPVLLEQAKVTQEVNSSIVSSHSV